MAEMATSSAYGEDGTHHADRDAGAHSSERAGDKKDKKERSKPKLASKPASLSYLPMKGLHNWDDLKSTHVFESRVHNEIAAVWDGLPEHERQQIRKYMARWGPLAQPHTEDPTTEDGFRSHFWRLKGQFPKCHSCWTNNGYMPTGKDIPLGLVGCSTVGRSISRDALPCGCEYDEALVEQWMVGRLLYEDRKNDGRIGAMGHAVRRAIYDLLLTFFDEVSFDMLCSRVKRRDLAKFMVIKAGRMREDKWDWVEKWEDKPNKDHPGTTRKEKVAAEAAAKALVRNQSLQKRRADDTTMTEETAPKRQKGKAPALVENEPGESSVTSSAVAPLDQDQQRAEEDAELVNQSLTKQEGSQSWIKDEPIDSDDPMVEEALRGLGF